MPGEKFKFILSTGPLLPGYRGVIYVNSISEKRLKAKEYDQVRDSNEIFFSAAKGEVRKASERASERERDRDR